MKPSKKAQPDPSSGKPVVAVNLSVPTPNIFPTALNFGSVKVGKTSAPKETKLGNIGNSRLNISNITVTGDFQEINRCGKGVAIGKSCNLQVTFKPTAKGLRSGTLIVQDNAVANPQKINLEGTGK